MNNTLAAKNTLGTTFKGWLAVGTLAIITAGTLGTAAIQPVQAQTQHRSFIRRHPFLTAGAAVTGGLMYRHHMKKKARQQQRMMRTR